MHKVELEVIGLVQNYSQSNSYAVILHEVGGLRKLPVVIGAFEAQAIALALENIGYTRPLTHDLMKNLSDAFDIELQEVIINNLLEGVFYSKLVCRKDETTVEIDSRTSDAIALALRFNCPVYTYDFILDNAGVTLEAVEKTENLIQPAAKKEERSKPKSKNDLTQYSIQELQDMLDECLHNEEYEKASLIRDELSKRKD